jgi:hypothetical protein
MFSMAQDQRVGLWRDAQDLRLGVLRFELLAQQGQLLLRTGPEQEPLLAPGADQFQGERFVAGARLQPVFHRLRLALAFVSRHDEREELPPWGGACCVVAFVGGCACPCPPWFCQAWAEAGSGAVSIVGVIGWEIIRVMIASLLRADLLSGALSLVHPHTY